MERPALTRDRVLLLTRALSVAGGLAVLGATALAQPAPGHVESLRRQASERLQVLRAEADRLLGEERTLLGRLRQLELERQIASEELKDADAAADAAAASLTAVDAEVAALDQARASDRPRLASRFIDLYKLGRGRYLRLFLSAQDMRRVGQAARTVAALADRDRARAQAYEARLVELAASRTTLAQQQQALDRRRADAARARATASQAIAAHTALVRQIDERRDLNAQFVSELQAAHHRLDTAVAGLAGAPSPAGVTAASGESAAGGPMPALPIGPFRGALPWPATGVVLRRARDAASSQRPGIEIQADEGSAIHAIHGGIVAYAGSFDGLGQLVILDHGEQTFSLYGHLLELQVGRGATVADRQAIGRLGTSPTGTPSLYFELRVKGRAVDPLPWLERPR